MASPIEFHESGDPAGRHPLRHENRAVLQEDRIVGMNEPTRLEIRPWLATQIRGMTIAQHGDGFVLLVVERDHAFQIGNQHYAVTKVDVTGTPDPLGVQRDGLAIEVEDLQATVTPIRDHHPRLVAARILKTVHAVNDAAPARRSVLQRDT